MFKNLNIQLTHPICNCEEQMLQWSISNVDGKAVINFECQLCKSCLRVPYDKLTATIALDVPYPGPKLLPKPAPVEYTDNVIAFPKR